MAEGIVYLQAVDLAESPDADDRIEVLDLVETGAEDQAAPVDGVGIDQAERADAGIAQAAGRARLGPLPGLVVVGVVDDRDVALPLPHLRQPCRVPEHRGEIVRYPHVGAAHAHGANAESGEIADGALLGLGGPGAGNGEYQGEQSGTDSLHQNSSA